MIFLTAKSKNGQDYARPRVVALDEAALIVTPNTKGGLLTKVEEIHGNQKDTYYVYENPVEIAAWISFVKGTGAAEPSEAHIALGLDGNGNSAATTTKITKFLSEVDAATATSADGLQLDAATVGKVRVILNNTAVALEPWPQSSENFEGGADDAATTQAAWNRTHYICLTAGTWMKADDYTQA